MKPSLKEYIYSILEIVSGWIIFFSVIHFVFFLFTEIGPYFLKKTLRSDNSDYYIEKSIDKKPLCIYKDDTNCVP